MREEATTHVPGGCDNSVEKVLEPWKNASIKKGFCSGMHNALTINNAHELDGHFSHILRGNVAEISD